MTLLSARKPVLFFDFDGTITRGDVLDAVIEQFSLTDEWRGWEEAWQQGRVSTIECLRRQIAGLRVSAAEACRFVSAFPIDPFFAPIAAWCARSEVELIIVSDNFSVLIDEIMTQQGIPDLPVFANELTWIENRPHAEFPYRDAACPRCAHCKTRHLRRYADHTTIYVGDGLSDICPAVSADVVFAKAALATYLGEHGVAHQTFSTLERVLAFLTLHYGDAVIASELTRD